MHQHDTGSSAGLAHVPSPSRWSKLTGTFLKLADASPRVAISASVGLNRAVDSAKSLSQPPALGFIYLLRRVCCTIGRIRSQGRARRLGAAHTRMPPGWRSAPAGLDLPRAPQ